MKSPVFTGTCTALITPFRDSGSIAEAALKLNGIFEVAQKAADQYLENVKARASQPTGGVWPVLEQSDEEKPS